jgi:hypothetical protein
VSTRIVPVACSFWGGKTFSHSLGQNAKNSSRANVFRSAHHKEAFAASIVGFDSCHERTFHSRYG